jgi:hypothetical protein
MVPHRARATSRLLHLVHLVDELPQPPAPTRRGRPVVFPDRLFYQALVIMVLKRLPTVHSLLAVLAQDTPEIGALRRALRQAGRFPSRRTWERRLARLHATLPAQIADLGDALLTELTPLTPGTAAAEPALAIDSTVLRASGPPWHQKDRQRGHLPHTRIDPEAHWTQSGWHGWVYGYKLHLVVTAAEVWLPLRADLTPANVADRVQARTLLAALPRDIRVVLGDSQYSDSQVAALGARAGWRLVAPKRGGRHPRTDAGAAARQAWHRLRTRTIESAYSQLKAIFDLRRPLPTKGLGMSRRWVLGAVFVYQLTLRLRHRAAAPLRCGLKAFLQAA